MVLVGSEVVGFIALSNVIRWNFRSCSVGYWIAEAHNGRGHATAAVRRICELAFTELGLHRVEAGTLLANEASQHVLSNSGFSRIGVAPKYLEIAGSWQDHVLFQRVADGD